MQAIATLRSWVNAHPALLQACVFVLFSNDASCALLLYGYVKVAHFFT